VGSFEGGVQLVLELPVQPLVVQYQAEYGDEVAEGAGGRR
jgi:hypothetical protein